MQGLAGTVQRCGHYHRERDSFHDIAVYDVGRYEVRIRYFAVREEEEE